MERMGRGVYWSGNVGVDNDFDADDDNTDGNSDNNDAAGCGDDVEEAFGQMQIWQLGQQGSNQADVQIIMTMTTMLIIMMTIVIMANDDNNKN